jgi:hypothetical protein
VIGEFVVKNKGILEWAAHTVGLPLAAGLARATQPGHGVIAAGHWAGSEAPHGWVVFVRGRANTLNRGRIVQVSGPLPFDHGALVTVTYNARNVRGRWRRWAQACMADAADIVGRDPGRAIVVVDDHSSESICEIEVTIERRGSFPVQWSECE